MKRAMAITGSREGSPVGWIHLCHPDALFSPPPEAQEDFQVWNFNSFQPSSRDVIEVDLKAFVVDLHVLVGERDLSVDYSRRQKVRHVVLAS